MICTMIDVEKINQTFLIVIIEPSNFERMRKADPITLEAVARGGALPTPKFPTNMSMIVAYEEDDVELYRLCRSGTATLGELITYLERGRTWQKAADGRQNMARL